MIMFLPVKLFVSKCQNINIMLLKKSVYFPEQQGSPDRLLYIVVTSGSL